MSSDKAALKVTALYTYPVKSLGELAQQRCEYRAGGPVGDRRWMVVDNAGRFITQRELPLMSRIRLTQTREGFALIAPQHRVCRIPRRLPPGPLRTVTVWRDECQARSADTAINAWLSTELQRDVALVYLADDALRQVDLTVARPGDQVGFADGFPALLTTDASLAALVQAAGIEFDQRRFRPNIVINGHIPWQEDDWRVLRIGPLEFEIVKPCSRCAIPTLVPGSGERQPAVFKALQALRASEGEVYFGQNMVGRSDGWIQVGDPVKVLESGQRP